MKVFVGLSGGVDSAVSAALLQKEGHNVTGVFIRIALPGYPCTAGADRVDAMRVAAHLRIPFQEIDLSEEYKKCVFDASLKEFERGRTPNPDVLCNREIKFGLFYDWAMRQGADMIATGHYAQLVVRQGDALPVLQRGADKDKDQTYFLALVPQEALRHALFPIGHLQKSEVRALAEKCGLPNAARPDSQGLCFLGPVSVGDMLAKELRPEPGAVLDKKGEVVGSHRGAALYTLGQRHGFSAQSAGPGGQAVPLYVAGKDIDANTITVSASKFPTGASQTKIELSDANWIGSHAGGPCVARYRYRQALIPAKLQRSDLREPSKSQTFVILEEPHYAPEGQVLALYDGQRCLGGGVIKKSRLY